MKPASDGDSSMEPLGTLVEFQELLRPYNTAVDGGERSPSTGTQLLYGPGLMIEVPTSTEQVSQAIITVLDEEIAWPVLMRLCGDLHWAMMDMESGRIFGG
jgi:hypothetical protein